MTGDWGCRGRTTVALVRPATGGVYVLDRWPDGDEQMQAVRVATVDGATRVHAADPDGDGCTDLVVERVDGAPVVLRDVL